MRVALPFLLVILLVSTMQDASAAITVPSMDISPGSAQPGSTVQISVNVKNDGASSVKVQVDLYIYTASIPDQPTARGDLPLTAGGSGTATIPWTPDRAGRYSVKARAYVDKNGNGKFDAGEDGSEYNYPTEYLVEGGGTTDGGQLPFIYIVAILAVVVAVAVAAGSYMMIRKRKKKNDTLVTTAPAGYEQTQYARRVWGKMPREYYMQRREAAARLKPIGLTSAGIPLLRIPRNEIAPPAPMPDGTMPVADKKNCPKCGTAQEEGWLACEYCSVQEAVEKARKKLTAAEAAGADVVRAKAVLSDADMALAHKNYSDARTYAMDAGQKAADAISAHEAAGVPPPEIRSIPEPAPPVPAPASEPTAAPRGPVVLSPKKKNCTRCGRTLKDGGKCDYCAVESNLAAARDRVASAKASGADAANAESLMKRAEIAFKTENFARADDYIRQAGEEVDRAQAALASAARKTPVVSVRPPRPSSPPAPPGPGARCPHCGQSVERGWTLCPYCSKDIPPAAAQPPADMECPSCGKRVKAGWKMCPHCTAML